MASKAQAARLDYGARDRETWALLFARHRRTVFPYASREYLDGLHRLEPLVGSLAGPEALNARLGAVTPWRLSSSSGLTDGTLFFREIAQRRFPVSVEVRSREELDFSALPDMFHDVLGHVPYLLTPKGALAHRLFGEAARRGGYEAGLLQRLATLFWFSFEVGLLREDSAMKAFGAAILTSPKEIRNIDKVERQIEPFDLDRVLETSYEPQALQPRYFVLSSMNEVFAALRRLTPSAGR